MPRIEITDFDKWGNLLKSWATGQNRLGDGNTYKLPSTPQELKDQMARARVTGRIPDQIKFIQFIVPDDKTLVILLPSRAEIENAEKDLADGRPYPLPVFYKEAFGGSEPNLSDWKKFNAQRLGEYTINNCQ